MKQRKRNKQSDILFILISSFIVVFAWIAFTLYHIHITSTISRHIQYQLTPVNPTFNQQVIQGLKDREDINPQFGEQQSSSQTAAQSGQAAPTPPTSEISVSPNTPETPASEASRFAPSGTAVNRQGQ
jgi:hypothetical protein